MFFYLSKFVLIYYTFLPSLNFITQKAFIFPPIFGISYLHFKIIPELNGRLIGPIIFPAKSSLNSNYLRQIQILSSLGYNLFTYPPHVRMFKIHLEKNPGLRFHNCQDKIIIFYFSITKLWESREK